MRQLLIFVICWITPYIAYGTNTIDYDAIISQHQNTEQTIQSDFESIRTKVEKLNPKLVAESRNKSEKAQLVIYRSWITRQKFFYYRNYFISRIKERSTQSGRAITKMLNEPYKSRCLSSYYALDNGKIDTPECHVDGDYRKFQTCPYPDDLEEFYIDIIDCGDEMSIFVQEDDKANNTSSAIMIDISNKALIESGENLTDIYITTNIHKEKFTEYADYREKERKYVSNTRDNEAPALPSTHIIGMTFAFTSDTKDTKK